MTKRRSQTTMLSPFCKRRWVNSSAFAPQTKGKIQKLCIKKDVTKMDDWFDGDKFTGVSGSVKMNRNPSGANKNVNPIKDF